MKNLLVAFVATLAFASMSHAQERERMNFDPSQIVNRIMERDSDGDGKLTKEEAGERMADRFDSVDANKDGFLVKDEILSMFNSRRPGGQGRPGGAQNDRQRGQGGNGRRPGAGPGPGGMLAMLPLMQALDADKNGELSAQEIEGAVAALKSLDKNKDGKLAASEMLPDMSRMGYPQDTEAAKSDRPQRPPFDGEAESKEEKSSVK